MHLDKNLPLLGKAPKALALALAITLGSASITGSAVAGPIPAEQIARLPAIQSVSMSADGKTLVALIAAPGSNNQDTALATWNMDRLENGPTRITPSAERMKFIGASALKGDHILALARQEWTGALGGCGEGNSTGSTKTFISKAYLTNLEHSRFDEAFASNQRTTGVSEATLRCLELAGSASLVSLLPLDPDHVIISRLDPSSFSSNYLRYNLRTGSTELLFSGGGRSSPGLFHPRNGDLLTRNQIEPVGGSEYEVQILIRDASGQFVVHKPLSTRLTERYSVSVEGIDDATGNFYVVTNQFSEHAQLRLYDPKAQQYLPDVLAAHPEFDIGGVVFGQHESDFNQVLGFRVNGPAVSTVYTDATMEQLQAALQGSFAGKDIRIIDYNDDKTRVLFRVSAHDTPPSYHVLVDRRRLVALGSEHPSVSSAGSTTPHVTAARFRPSWTCRPAGARKRARCRPSSTRMAAHGRAITWAGMVRAGCRS